MKKEETMKEIFNYKSTLLAAAHAMRNSMKLVGRKISSGGSEGQLALIPVSPKAPNGSASRMR